MTAPKLNIDWSAITTLLISTALSSLVWLAGTIWYASALANDVDALKRDRDEHAVQIKSLTREGSELARTDHRRIDALERRAEANDATLAQMRDLLSRIDENVKALKEARR